MRRNGSTIQLWRALYSQDECQDSQDTGECTGESRPTLCTPCLVASRNQDEDTPSMRVHG